MGQNSKFGVTTAVSVLTRYRNLFHWPCADRSGVSGRRAYGSIDVSAELESPLVVRASLDGSAMPRAAVIADKGDAPNRLLLAASYVRVQLIRERLHRSRRFTAIASKTQRVA